MSEELEWELFEIFESGKFVFPMYEHKSARTIVRYLINRGVLYEEIADAIEDTSLNLEIWLNHLGKNMVGEWVIAWINETREEYDVEKQRELEEYEAEQMYRGVTPSYTTETESGDQDYSSDTELKTLMMGEQSSSDAECGVSNDVTIKADMVGFEGCDDVDLDRPPSYTPPPPPLPPRSLQELKDMNEELAKYSSIKKECDSELDREIAVEEEEGERSETGFYEIPIAGPSTCDSRSSHENLYERTSLTPDSGAAGLYSSIPVDIIDHEDNLNLLSEYYDSDVVDNEEYMALTTQSSPDFSHLSKSGLPICPNCTCKLTHFSLKNHNHKDINNHHRHDHDDDCDEDCEGDHNENHEVYCDLYLYSEAALRAMEYAFETLDRDGPGFIFIMTDCVKQCLPWSTNCRYKVSSSRTPERCQMEFRSRSIEIEMIWQVRVQYHLTAVREVQGILMEYNMHTNWFKCPLSTVVETVAKVAKKYKNEI